jgi:SepF-like predicted cell division protein (DUF552 family)
MKKETISQAIGEIDAKHINEAMNYHISNSKASIFRKPLGRSIIAATVCLCLLVGFGVSIPFGGLTVKAYAYGTNEEISKVDTVLSSGTITDDGEMRGHPLQFYLVGKDIATIRFSCKNQWIDFVDWTQKRDEYGIGKNFTVSYGEDESEYYYLTIDWVPKNTIRELTDNKDSVIKNLPIELREDIIVLQITYENGRSATKAMKIRLQDNGKFVASFIDYKITEQDEFIKHPDSPSISRDILYAEGDDAASQNSKGKISYQSALSEKEIEAAKTVALDYYKSTVWQIEKISVTADSNSRYNNTEIEAEYSAGNIIIFDVTAIRDGEIGNRTISVARADNGAWSVINEGF